MTPFVAALACLAQAEPAVPESIPANALESTVGLSHYLVLSAIVFGIGLLVVITRRNAIALLMGIELMLNAAGLNFVAFAKFSALADRLDGQVVTLFIIVIAAAEAALALAIVLNIYNNLNTVQVDEARSLRG
jgi:NADH-quinone oxidoreductase subunit K